MPKKVTGTFYRATIDKSYIVTSTGEVLDFTVDISCQDWELFQELIEYIERFKKPTEVISKRE